jgi:hypothetical protein
MNDEVARIKSARRALYVRVQSAVIDWHSLRQYASSRIETHKNNLVNADPANASEIARIQGQIDEDKYILNLENTIREYLKANPVKESDSETISSK